MFDPQTIEQLKRAEQCTRCPEVIEAGRFAIREDDGRHHHSWHD